MRKESTARKQFVQESTLPVSNLAVEAVANVLWQMANIDNRVPREECEKALAELIQGFGISQADAIGAIRRVDNYADSEEAFDESLSVICEVFNKDQRARIFSMICGVALADRAIDNREHALAEEIKQRLDIQIRKTAGLE